ncbi:MAG: hypothetical protein WCK03_04805 [Candidatus Taylorbacteria bacterium]
MLAWRKNDKSSLEGPTFNLFSPGDGAIREEMGGASLIMDWQSPRNKKWIRTVASFIIVAFLNQDIVWAQGGNPVWAKPPVVNTANKTQADLNTNIAIPKDVAVTKEAFDANSDKTIINIQDAHSSIGAQESIATILDSLVTNYDLELIAIEGSTGYVDTSLLRTFPDEKVRHGPEGSYCPHNP